MEPRRREGYGGGGKWGRWRDVGIGVRQQSCRGVGAGVVERLERIGGSGRWMRAGQSSESRRRSQRSDWRSMKEERFFPPPPLAGLPRPAAD